MKKILIAIIAVALLGGCEMRTDSEVEVDVIYEYGGIGRVRRVEDTEKGVVCYVAKQGVAASISCVKLPKKHKKKGAKRCKF